MQIKAVIRFALTENYDQFFVRSCDEGKITNNERRTIHPKKKTKFIFKSWQIRVGTVQPCIDFILNNYSTFL